MGSMAARDHAGILGELPRMTPDGTLTNNTIYGWISGTLTWKVPFGWKNTEDYDDNALPVGIFAEDTRQIMSIRADGTFSVQKLGHTAVRQIDGRITVDGREDDGILDN